MRVSAVSTFARELKALMRTCPSPHLPKPAPGVHTTCARWSSRSKNSSVALSVLDSLRRDPPVLQRMRMLRERSPASQRLTAWTGAQPAAEMENHHDEAFMPPTSLADHRCMHTVHMHDLHGEPNSCRYLDDF